MQRNHLKKKGYEQFLVKKKIGAIRKKFSFDLFFNLNFFHVFLIKVLNIISTNQNRYMHDFTRKNSKVELHLSNFFLVA